MGFTRDAVAMVTVWMGNPGLATSLGFPVLHRLEMDCRPHVDSAAMGLLTLLTLWSSDMWLWTPHPSPGTVLITGPAHPGSHLGWG